MGTLLPPGTSSKSRQRVSLALDPGPNSTRPTQLVVVRPIREPPLVATSRYQWSPRKAGSFHPASDLTPPRRLSLATRGELWGRCILKRPQVSLKSRTHHSRSPAVLIRGRFTPISKLGLVLLGGEGHLDAAVEGALVQEASGLPDEQVQPAGSRLPRRPSPCPLPAPCSGTRACSGSRTQLAGSHNETSEDRRQRFRRADTSSRWERRLWDRNSWVLGQIASQPTSRTFRIFSAHANPVTANPAGKVGQQLALGRAFVTQRPEL